MPAEFITAHQILSSAVAGKTIPTAQLVIRVGGRSVFSQAYGFLDPDTRLRPAANTTLFDLASITKLFTAAAFMHLVENGLLSLDQPVVEVLPAFRGLRPVMPYEDPQNPGAWVDVTGSAHQPNRQVVTVDARTTTFRQILRHSSGLPAWRPIKNQPDSASARSMAVNTFFSAPPDTCILYSDIGYILLGLAIEAAAGPSLDRVITEHVTGPLGLYRTRFLPIGNTIPLEVAPTEYSREHNRLLMGEVHDEAAYRMGGVAGHAGIFSTADELARFGQSFLSSVRVPANTGPLTRPLSPSSIAEMTTEQFNWQSQRRGLGFDLWNSDPQSPGSPFSPASFGHTGYTGTSLWVDPDRELVVAFLTNEIYNGRENRSIIELRRAVHSAIVQELKERPG